MEINITNAIILRQSFGMDRIVLKTDLPEPCYPYDGLLELHLNVARGRAEEYMREHPGVERQHYPRGAIATPLPGPAGALPRRGSCSRRISP